MKESGDPSRANHMVKACAPLDPALEEKFEKAASGFMAALDMMDEIEKHESFPLVAI